MRHNALRDTIANMMREVCTDVTTEPALLPVEPNNFNKRTNTSDMARLDISARGVNSKFERTFYDVRVTHPFADSNITLELQELYKKNECEKITMYEERVRNSEKASFTPLVFSTTGGMGPKCEEAMKKLARMMSEKRGERYESVITFMRVNLRFALLRSTLIAVRGERGKLQRSLPYMSKLNLDLERHEPGSYEV